MNIKSFIAIIILIAVCYYGVIYYSNTNNVTTSIDAPLVSIIDEWKQVMLENNITCDGPVGRLQGVWIMDDSVVGQIPGAVAFADPVSHIIGISKSQALKGFYTTRATLWHELGHYVFQLDHMECECLMNEDSYTEEEYIENWEMFKAEYIKTCKENEGRAAF